MTKIGKMLLKIDESVRTKRTDFAFITQLCKDLGKGLKKSIAEDLIYLFNKSERGQFRIEEVFNLYYKFPNLTQADLEDLGVNEPIDEILQIDSTYDKILFCAEVLKVDDCMRKFLGIYLFACYNKTIEISNIYEDYNPNVDKFKSFLISLGEFLESDETLSSINKHYTSFIDKRNHQFIERCFDKIL